MWWTHFLQKHKRLTQRRESISGQWWIMEQVRSALLDFLLIGSLLFFCVLFLLPIKSFILAADEFR